MTEGMGDTYKTLAAPGQGLYKSKGSKFISFAYPVRTEDDVKRHLDLLRKEFHDARHHCYAYITGFKQEYFRANDDGEPNNSAGKPILGQLYSFELTNTLVVVVRYFGGTLLGVGGLITAYKSAAEDTLKNATIITRTVEETISVHFGYEDISQVMRILKDDEITVSHQKLEMDCTINFEIRKNRTEEFVEKLENLKTTKVRVIKPDKGNNV